MLYIYITLLILALISGYVMLWKVPMIKNEATTHTSLSVIIPARNEERNLPALLHSLKNQTVQPLEILVVDDESEDDTARVAIQYGATVISRTPDKSGWVGKSAVCWEGALAAKGDWLLFLDADTSLAQPNSLEQMGATFQQKGATGLLSIQPFHTIEAFYENFSTVFNIMVLAGMNGFSIFQKKLEPGGAFGPSLLCTREEYFKLGGHKHVQESIMENIVLGKHFLNEGYPVSLYGGKDTLHFRMYPEGIDELVTGWTKSFASASLSTHPAVLMAIILWMTGAIVTGIGLPYAFLQEDSFFLLIALLGYGLYGYQFFRMARLAGNFHWYVLLLYPLLFIFFVGLFVWSLIKTYLFRTVSWKGRQIRL